MSSQALLASLKAANYMGLKSEVNKHQHFITNITELKERYTHLNAEFQRMARRDRKAFLSDQCKEI